MQPNTSTNTITNTNANTNNTIIDIDRHQSPNYLPQQYYSDQQQDDHSTSLIVEDYDFTSSAESESSSNLFESEPLETTRMLKRKKSTQLISLSATSSSISLLSTRPLSPSTSTSSLPPIYSCSTLNLPPLMPHPSEHSNSLLSDCPSSQFDQHSKLTSTNSHDQFSHSHHYRTSTVARKTQHASAGFDALNHQPQHNSTARFPSKSSDSPRRSKRSWFSSSRRQKRKNSIHALSASSLSSSTSLHSPNLSPREHKNQLPHPSSKFGFTNSARQQRHHHKYASRSHSPFRRSGGWARNIIGLISRSFHSISPFIPSKKPLVIILALIFTASFLAGFISFLIHFFDTDRAPLPWRTYCQSQREFPHAFADSLPPVTVFVGVFSVDSAYERRHLIRLTYARHSRPIDQATGRPGHNVQLKFIIGRPRVQHLRRVALEMETFNDLVVLDIDENMNRGKTYAYFRWAAENATIPFYFHREIQVNQTTSSGNTDVIGNDEEGRNEQVAVGFRKADFVVKADDDAFIVLSELERHLRVAPRNKTYWGYLIRNLFMGGECYALSSDLVDYVATSPSVLKHLTGAEDKKVAKWMRIHPNATAINWVTERCWIYDHPKAGTTYAHGFLFPDEVSRIRAEGRLGLSDEDLERRGGKALSQSFSTVTKFGEQYLPPRSGMTMEEEVEARIEGGGNFDRKVLAKMKERVPVQSVLFEADDARLSRPSTRIDATTATTEAEGRTQPVLDHDGSFRPLSAESVTAGLKFGRPPSELLAGLPPYEDLVESAFKQAIARHLADQQQKLIDPPALRYDVDEIQLRLQRFEGRLHGGTVVVHYLKRNEWFLETELVLLGKARTWDDGLDAIAYQEPALQQPTNKKQTVPEVGAALRKGEMLKTIEAGGSLFGGARMYGSPAIKSDGRISEGSREDRLAPSQDSNTGLSELSRTVAGGAGWVRGRPKVRVSDMDEGPIFGGRISSAIEESNNSTKGQAEEELRQEDVNRAPAKEEEATKIAAAGGPIAVDKQLRLPVDQGLDPTGVKSGPDVEPFDMDTEMRVGLSQDVAKDDEAKVPGERNVVVATMSAGIEEKNSTNGNQTEAVKPDQRDQRNSRLEADDDQSTLDLLEVNHHEDGHEHHHVDQVDSIPISSPSP